MSTVGLAVLATPSQPLFIDRNWSNARFGRELNARCPQVMAYLERKTRDVEGNTSQLWYAVLKDGKRLSLSDHKSPTGVELAQNCKVSGTAKGEWVLYIGMTCRPSCSCSSFTHTFQLRKLLSLQAATTIGPPPTLTPKLKATNTPQTSMLLPPRI